MGLGQEQKNREPRICQCGCEEIFYPFPMYPRDKNGNLRYPSYKRGHHPSPQNTQFGKNPAWNKGMKKDDHPSLSRMGFQKGHKPYYITPRSESPYSDPRNYQDYKKFCASILKRDGYTCQLCGDHNYQGRGGSITLEVDHIVPVAIDKSRLLDPTNVRTLCNPCHRKTETYGGRVKKLKKKHLELKGK